MKFYILFFISLVLCYCDGTSRRSGGNQQKNSGKETDASNTAFWAARGKRNDMPGILKCAFVRPHDDFSEDSDFSWNRPSEQNELPVRSDINTEAWDARFKRSSTEQSRPFYLPSWVVRALTSSAGNTRSTGNNENVPAWLRMIEKRNEKDGGNGAATTTDPGSLPFWASRG